MRFFLFLIIVINSQSVKAQEKTDTLPYENFEKRFVSEIDVSVYRIVDTIQNPDGFILEDENNFYEHRVALRQKNGYQILDYPTTMMSNVFVKSERKKIIKSKYSQLIVYTYYENGFSHSNNGHYEYYEGVVVYDLSEFKILFSIDYLSRNESWFFYDDDTVNVHNSYFCDCNDIRIERNIIELVPNASNNKTPSHPEKFIFTKDAVLRKYISESLEP